MQHQQVDQDFLGCLSRDTINHHEDEEEELRRREDELVKVIFKSPESVYLGRGNEEQEHHNILSNGEETKYEGRGQGLVSRTRVANRRFGTKLN